MPKFGTHRKSELTYRRGSDYRGWKGFNGENPYEERYGDAQPPIVDLYTGAPPEDDAPKFRRVPMWEYMLLTSPKMKKHANIENLADHIIAEGDKIFADTARKDTWVTCHDHLNIWWDKRLQAYLKTLRCGVPGWPDRTWFDRQLRIMGPTNNSNIVTRHQNKVVGDTPEGQVLDCHVFSFVKETAGINVAMTCHLPDNDAAKYSFATPEKTFDALERTIKEGEWDELAIKDWDRIWDHKREDNTWKRIKAAQGTCIEDSGKRVRSGVRRQLQDAAQAEAVELKPSKAAEEKFMEMERELRSGGGFGQALWMKDLTFAADLERVDAEDDEEANGEIDYDASVDLQESSSDDISIVDDSDEEEGMEVELIE